MRTWMLIFLTGCVDLKLVNVGPDGGLWTTPVVWESQDLPEGFRTRDVTAAGHRLFVSDPIYDGGGLILEPRLGGTDIFATGTYAENLGHRIHTEDNFLVSTSTTGDLRVFDLFGNDVRGVFGEYTAADSFDGVTALADDDGVVKTLDSLSDVGPLFTDMDFVPNPYGGRLADDLVVSDYGVMAAVNGCHVQQVGFAPFLSWWKSTGNQGFLDEAAATDLFPTDPSSTRVRLKWHVNSRRYGLACENDDGSFRYQLVDYQYGVTVSDFHRVRDVAVVEVNDAIAHLSIVADDDGDYVNLNYTSYSYAFLGEFPFENCDARIVNLDWNGIALVCLGDNRLAFGSVQDFFSLYDSTR